MVYRLVLFFYSPPSIVVVFVDTLLRLALTDGRILLQQLGRIIRKFIAVAAFNFIQLDWNQDGLRKAAKMAMHGVVSILQCGRGRID